MGSLSVQVKRLGLVCLCVPAYIACMPQHSKFPDLQGLASPVFWSESFELYGAQILLLF